MNYKETTYNYAYLAILQRNQFIYDPFLPVYKVEAKIALRTAEDFVDKTFARMKKENIQLRLDFNQ